MKVLIVDDRPSDVNVLARLLGRRDVVVRTAPSAAAALNVLDEEGPFDYVVSDYMLGPNCWDNEDHNGAYLLSKVSAKYPETRTILFTMSEDLSEILPFSIDAHIVKHRSGVMKLMEWIDNDFQRSKNKNE